MKNPQYAFILPDKRTERQMEWAREATIGLRQDQIDRMWQMMASWRIGEGAWADVFFAAMRRAVRKVKQNYP